jgi:hypothetical protein
VLCQHPVHLLSDLQKLSQRGFHDMGAMIDKDACSTVQAFSSWVNALGYGHPALWDRRLSNCPA